MGLFKEKKQEASAYHLGQGLIQVVRGSTSNKLFEKLQVKSWRETGEFICGALWAAWIGICKSGLEHPISDSVLEGMKSMITDPKIYGYVGGVVNDRIKEYNDLMYQSPSDHPLLLVSKRFIEQVKSVDSELVQDVFGYMEISILLAAITGVVINTLKAAQEEYEIV